MLTAPTGEWPLRVLDLFSGIGGFSLGLERTGGFKTIAFCEIDPFCRAVLAKHWPGVPCYEDVRMIGGTQYRGQVDVVTGGVPCQPASVAGKRKGVNDDRWLWPHFLSVVRAVQPVWVLAENPRGIISLKPHGLAWIERELHAAGYETQCFCIGADDVGAPQERKRIWIVAHRSRCGQSGQPEAERSDRLRVGPGGDEGLADPNIGGRRIEVAGREAQGRTAAGRSGEGVAYSAVGGLRTDGSAPRDAGHVDIGRADVADSERDGRRSWSGEPGDEGGAGSGRCESARGVQLADAHQPGREERHATALAGESEGRNASERWPARPGEPQHEWEAPRLVLGRRCWNLWRDFCSRTSEVDTREWYEETQWKFKRGLGFAVDGPPSRLARFANKQGLRACGNAVVPQVVEIIGQAILAKAAKAKRGK